MIATCPPGAPEAGVRAVDSAMIKEEEEIVAYALDRLTRHDSKPDGHMTKRDLHVQATAIHALCHRWLEQEGEVSLNCLRRHFPACAALGRVLVPAMKRQARNMRDASRLSRQQSRKQRACSSLCTGGMLNFGLSGGMGLGPCPSITKQRWHDASVWMTSVNADWWFGISVRCPPEVNVAIEVPSFDYVMHGHKSTSFGAVAVFVRCGVESACTFMGIAVVHLNFLGASGMLGYLRGLQRAAT